MLDHTHEVTKPQFKGRPARKNIDEMWDEELKYVVEICTCWILAFFEDSHKSLWARLCIFHPSSSLHHWVLTFSIFFW